MAKRGRKRKSTKKRVFKYNNALIGLFLVLLAVLGLGGLGPVGRFIHFLALLLFGGLFSYFVFALMIGTGIYLIVKGSDADLFSLRFIGIYLIIIGGISLVHKGFFESDTSVMNIFNKTIDHISHDYHLIMDNGAVKDLFYSGGGIFGAILSIILVKLCSLKGMYIISGVIIAGGVFLIFSTDLFAILSDKFNEARERAKLKADEFKMKKSKVPTEEKLGATQAIITGLSTKKEEEKVEDPVIIHDPIKKEKVVINENYELPPISLLNETKDKGVNAKVEQDAINSNIEQLETLLGDFNINATVKEVHVGPSVAQYELEVASGTRVNRITSINREIALELGKKDVRIEAPIPGKRTVGIEFATDHPKTVSFREIIDSNDMKNHMENKLLVPLGKTIMGDIGTCRIDKMPHLLIAGTTGSGKSVCVNGIICSILMRARPDEVKLAMVDPKVVELSVYNGIPHLLCPVVNDPKEASVLLQKMVKEMENRYHTFSDSGTKNIESYNNYVENYNKKNTEKKDKMPYVVIIIDELSDLMMVAAKDVEDSILRITQKARAAGMHLVVATQRPSTEVITGLIKANIPSRIAFAVGSGIDSRTILDSTGAEKLLGKGDMLYLPIGTNTPIRIQGSFINDNEIKRVVDFVKKQQKAQYDESLSNLKSVGGSTSGGIDLGDLDPLYNDVVDLIVSTKKASASMIQRKFKVGYNRAGRIIDELEETGVIRKPEGSNTWEVVGKPSLPEQVTIEDTVTENTIELTDSQVEEINEEIELDDDNLLDEIES